MTYTDPGDGPRNATWRRTTPTVTPGIDLFLSAAKAETEKRDAMAQAELHASQRWLDAAYEAVILVSGLLPEFTSTDVIAALTKGGKDVIESERNLTAMGSVMLRAARNGLIVKTGAYIPTGHHKRPQACWRKTTVDEFRQRQPDEA